MEEEVDIILSYKHTFAGTTFRLPVILNVCDLPPAGGVVNTGKQIVMCLVGETIHQNESRLALPMADSRKYKEGEWGFQTVPIGLINPPVQVALQISRSPCFPLLCVLGALFLLFLPFSLCLSLSLSLFSLSLAPRLPTLLSFLSLLSSSSCLQAARLTRAYPTPRSTTPL